MVDPVISSSTNRPIFFIDLSGQNSNPMIPDSFISNHFKGNFQSTKLKLTSDASDRAWEVELDGQRFADGWKGFSISHSVRDDDVLSFRHDGDMVFHVTPVGRNDYDNLTSDEDLPPKKTSSKKRARIDTDSSSDKSCLDIRVTSSSLRRNHMCLVNKFVRSNGLTNRCGEIDLKNEDGKSWTLGLRHNKTTGQVFINGGGWSRFCNENGLQAGSSRRFKLVENGTKPVLQLCPNISNGNSSQANKNLNVSGTEGNDEVEYEDRFESASMNQNRILTFDLKQYMIRSSQLRLPASLTREHGITEAGEITVTDKDGVEWKLHLVNIKGRGELFYIRGLKGFFLANGITKLGDSFTLEVIRGGTSPIVKICSKVKETPPIDGYKTPETNARTTVQEPSRAEKYIENPVQKRARVSADGREPSRVTRESNKSSADLENLQLKQPLQPCSISDQVTKVKQSIIDTLTCVRLFRSELQIKEQNLEVSLLEIDALGEKIVGIGKFFNMNQV
ncbi:unnamed protein product [Arabis nemorensis]|uniref:TF-B3 domain-containing protein n=1 Tax=Arabis nemorensis TaxID=586526 RepID=A0A565CAX9_9BRAS|nr:unnamed protein product [Arabis nemorensis]